MNENTFRHAIDISPWNKSGKSFWGMRRENAKKLALAIMTLGFFFSTPPTIPTPDDFLNIFLAKYIVSWFGISKLMALTLTYTLVGWGLMYLGIVIYPANTHSLLNGYINKAQRYINKLKKEPILIFALIIAGYYTFKWYLTIL